MVKNYTFNSFQGSSASNKECRVSFPKTGGAHFALTFNNFHGVQVRLVACVDVENLLGIPDHAVQVTWQNHLSTDKDFKSETRSLSGSEE